MNWQFFATAGVISTIMLTISLVLWALVELEIIVSVRTYHKTIFIYRVLFYSVWVFWFLIGIFCLLNLIWDWGLVK